MNRSLSESLCPEVRRYITEAKAALDGAPMTAAVRSVQETRAAIRRLWSVEDLSAYLGVPVRTLYQWRTKRCGPPGRRVGRYVRYRPEDVEAWLDSETR